MEKINSNINRITSIENYSISEEILSSNNEYINPNRESQIDLSKNMKSFETGYYLLEKVETIYQNMKSETVYHKVLKVTLLIFAMVSYSFMFSFLFLFSSNRQNIYCFNTRIHQLEQCSKDQLCENYSNGLSIIIYDQGPLSNITNVDLEIQNVNKKYKEFFSVNSQIFSKITYDRLNIYYNFFDKFNGGVMLTEAEQINVSIKYCDLCNYSTSLIMFGAFMSMGSILGNVTLTIWSDILGRRKLFIISLTAIITFCFLIFLLIIYLDLKIQKDQTSFINDNSKHLNPNYSEILLQLNFSLNSRETFKSFKFVFAVFLFILFFFNTCAQNCGLCLLLENCINDASVLENYMIYNNGFIMSIFYSYVSNYAFDSFKYNFLISAIILSNVLVIAIYYFEESPRQFFEYSEWGNFTKVIDRIMKHKKELINMLYKGSRNFQEITQKENQALNVRQSVILQSLRSKLKRKSAYDILTQNLIEIKNSMKRGNNLIITRDEVKRNPLIILTCIFYENAIRSNIPIIWAFLVIVFLVFNLFISSFFARFFFLRDGLFNIYIINSSFTHITILLVFSNLFYYLMHKFFGFKHLMTTSLIFFSIFSFAVALPQLKIPNYLQDMNQYNYGLIYNYIIAINGAQIRVYFFFMGFFAFGIYFSTYLYVFKYTKTLYRGTFLGIVNIINKLTFLLAILIIAYLSHGILIASLLSFTGLFTILFLTSKDQDFNIISDKRKFDYYGGR